MTKAKITVESGKYKAIFNIDNEQKDVEQMVQLTFDPELSLNTEKENIPEVNAVKNIAMYLLRYLGEGE